MAIVQGDRTALNIVTLRECTSASSVEERDLCLRTIVSESQGIYSTAVERTQTAFSTLRQIVDRLSRTSTPKTIVYISEGVVLERPDLVRDRVARHGARDTTQRGTALAEIEAMQPRHSQHQPGQEVPEDHWAYRLAKKHWFFGFGAYS